MNRYLKEKKPVLFILVFAGLVLLTFLLMQPLEIGYAVKHVGEIAVLFPKGIIALKERNLLYIIQAIMLLVVIPVYILTFAFSWFYRAHNPQGKYDPDLDDHKVLEWIWWGIPCVIILAIGILTWIETHKLDPYKPLVSDKKPMTIQVVALQWKWLFIYPEENIATVNFVQFPQKTPIRFEITADAPMNSLWIPQLGGQIYAMPAMKTELNLIADTAGSYRGSSANISGEGFASMFFTAKATTDEDFQKWVAEAQKSANVLNLETYNQLAAPSSKLPPTLYRLDKPDLFDHILMKYMEPKK